MFYYQGEIKLKKIEFVSLVFISMFYSNILNAGSEIEQLVKSKKYEQAAAEYAKSKTNIDMLNEASCYYKFGDFKKALDKYLILLPNINNDLKAGLLYNIANTYYSLGKYESAEEYYIKSLKIAPNTQNAVYNLTLAQSKISIANNSSKSKKSSDLNKNQKKDDIKNDKTSEIKFDKSNIPALMRVIEIEESKTLKLYNKNKKIKIENKSGKQW